MCRDFSDAPDDVVALPMRIEKPQGGLESLNSPSGQLARALPQCPHLFNHYKDLENGRQLSVPAV